MLLSCWNAPTLSLLHVILVLGATLVITSRFPKLHLSTSTRYCQLPSHLAIFQQPKVQYLQISKANSIAILISGLCTRPTAPNTNDDFERSGGQVIQMARTRTLLETRFLHQRELFDTYV